MKEEVGVTLLLLLIPLQPQLHKIVESDGGPITRRRQQFLQQLLVDGPIIPLRVIQPRQTNITLNRAVQLRLIEVNPLLALLVQLAREAAAKAGKGATETAEDVHAGGFEEGPDGGCDGAGLLAFEEGGPREYPFEEGGEAVVRQRGVGFGVVDVAPGAGEVAVVREGVLGRGGC